jgi:hypothetical protein
MDFMTFHKWPGLCLAALMATALCSAQQHFPLRPGEWTANAPDPSHPGQPMTMLFCMNDETWTKALNHNPACTFSLHSLTSSGGSYSVSCGGPNMQMKGDFKMTFDGMTHMSTSGTMDITYGGQTHHSESTVDFHWKAPTCNPNADVNLRDHSKPPQ